MPLAKFIMVSHMCNSVNDGLSVGHYLEQSNVILNNKNVYVLVLTCEHRG